MDTHIDDLPTDDDIDRENREGVEFLLKQIDDVRRSLRLPRKGVGQPETPPATTKGHYRLTPDDIKSRKRIVKKANQLRRDNSKKTWADIAKELDISERTLRDWRHNPEYQ